MKLKSFDFEILFELLNPTKYVKDALSQHFFKTVDKGVYKDVFEFVYAIKSIRLALFINWLIVATILPVYGFLVVKLTNTLISTTLASYIFKMVIYINIVGFTLPMVWWIYNNRIGYCIYLHLLGRLLTSLYIHGVTPNKKAVILNHYLTCASKEWDYYDQTGEL